MAGMKSVINIWKNVREIDLQPIREEALQTVKIAIVGAPGVGRHTLADQMRSDPARPNVTTQTPILVADLESPAGVAYADLIILMLDPTRTDFQAEQAAGRRWRDMGKKLLVFCNKVDLLGEGQVLSQWMGSQGERMLYGSALDRQFLVKIFVPAVLELLPDMHLAIGRLFPLFRVTIAQRLINETCFSNAAYALSTGIAEIIPQLDLPLNLADMIILTKSQAFLAFKLGLAVGFSIHWQDYLAEFGSVIGSGFLWRQLARSLIGLIPVYGIIPKVAVAYSGTFVVGNTVLQWYLTGRHISGKQIQELYKQAFAKGKAAARQLIERVPRPRFGKRSPAGLPKPDETIPELNEGQPTPEGLLPPEAATPASASGPEQTHKPARPSRFYIGKRSPEEGHPGDETSQPVRKKPPFQLGKGKRKACPQCGKASAADAQFCQYCGNSLV